MKFAPVALAASAGLVAMSVGLPNTELAWLRAEYRWLGTPLNWIEHQWPDFGVVHVVLFALLGASACATWPRASLWRLAVGLFAFGCGSELLQAWVPGRTPMVRDLVDDFIGAALGVGIGSLIRIWQVPRQVSGLQDGQDRQDGPGARQRPPACGRD